MTTQTGNSGSWLPEIVGEIDSWKDFSLGVVGYHPFCSSWDSSGLKLNSWPGQHRSLLTASRSKRIGDRHRSYNLLNPEAYISVDPVINCVLIQSNSQSIIASLLAVSLQGVVWFPSYSRAPANDSCQVIFTAKWCWIMNYCISSDSLTIIFLFSSLYQNNGQCSYCTVATIYTVTNRYTTGARLPRSSLSSAMSNKWYHSICGCCESSHP